MQTLTINPHTILFLNNGRGKQGSEQYQTEHGEETDLVVDKWLAILIGWGLLSAGIQMQDDPLPIQLTQKGQEKKRKIKSKPADFPNLSEGMIELDCSRRFDGMLALFVSIAELSCLPQEDFISCGQALPFHHLCGETFLCASEFYPHVYVWNFFSGWAFWLIHTWTLQ